MFNTFNASDEVIHLDRLVHEPARLIILTALRSCGSCDYRSMQAVTHLSSGNLSTHLQKLEAGQLVEISKGYKGRVPQTMLRITAEGRSALERHWKQLEDLRSRQKEWRPEPSSGESNQQSGDSPARTSESHSYDAARKELDA